MRNFFWIWCPLINFTWTTLGPWFPSVGEVETEISIPLYAYLMLEVFGLAFALVFMSAARRGNPEYEPVTRWLEINSLAVMLGQYFGGMIWSLLNGPDWNSFGCAALATIASVLLGRFTFRYCWCRHGTRLHFDTPPNLVFEEIAESASETSAS